MRTIDRNNIDLMRRPPDNEPQRQYYFMAKCREYVKAESKKAGRPLTCAVITFGCQMHTEPEKARVRII